MSRFYCRDEELRKLNKRYENGKFECVVPPLFTDPACGHVLRAKGFVQDENGWVELNATADGLTANAIHKGQEVLIVIGEGLEKERIEVRLKG